MAPRDLTAAANATNTLHQPFGYVRGDGVTVVLYRGPDDHVHKLTLQDGRWRHFDLTTTTKGPLCSSVHATGYVRADGVTSVVCRAADSHIHEMTLP